MHRVVGEIGGLVLGGIVAFVFGCTGAGGDGTGGGSSGSSDGTSAGPTTNSPTTTMTTTSASMSGSGSTGSADTGSTSAGPTGTDTAGSSGDNGSSSDSSSGSSSTGEPPVEMMLVIERIGRYAPEPLDAIFDEGAAEISGYDPVTQSLLVTNGQTASIDVLDLSDPTMPAFVQAITISDPMLEGPTSLSVSDGVIAAAAPSIVATDPGQIVFFDVDGTELSSVAVGVLPDMVTFSPDGDTVLVANEGEPTGYDPGDLDPEGSISIIDVSGGPASVTPGDVSTAGFSGLMAGDLDDSTRIFGPGSTIAQDLEPEYVAVSPDSATAWVSLQENNAMAIVDVASATVTDVVGLGWVDHSITGLDASDSDTMINIATWPVFGMRQPDALAAFEVGGQTYVVSANEGDARDYGGLDEATRISNLTLDPMVFPNAEDLQMDINLGRLQVTEVNGDIDGDGDHDELWSFGSRSITIFDAAGAVVWDSGDAIEQATALAFPDDFNCDNDQNMTFDGRSDNSGPEPEGVTVGEAFGTPYAFVGLERVGGFMVWDLTDVANPELWGIINPRDFTGDPEMGMADDLAPEGLLYIQDVDSPTGFPLLVVTNEVSGTVSIYELTQVPVER